MGNFKYVTFFFFCPEIELYIPRINFPGIFPNFQILGLPIKQTHWLSTLFSALTPQSFFQL